VVDDKIPGDVTGKVKKILPKVILALHLIDDCKGKSEEDTLKCISEKLFMASEMTTDAFYHSLAVTLAKELSDGKLSFGDAIALVEWYFRTQVKK
jgi:hypothetical protein